jgi:uncharacterized protein YjbI with pentapeptide repeats
VSDANQPPARTAAPLAASAIILSFAYIAMTVSGHSDVDLIRPDTQVSLEKVSLPSAWIFGPLAGAKLSVLQFYAAAPLIVLWLHFEFLRHPPAPDDPWAKLLRLAGNVLPPATLFLLLWKFAPYANARPDDVSGVSLARGLSRFHSATLFLDAALYLYVSLDALPGTAIAGSARAAWLRRIGVALVALRQAGLLWLAAFCVATLLAANEAEREGLRQFLGAGYAGLVIGLAVLICAAVWLPPILLRYVQASALARIGFGRTYAPREATTMRKYILLFATLLVSAALPDLGRPLNLSGARLAAAEPSEAVIAAMIAATYGAGDTAAAERARQNAWRSFSSGLNYAHWKFPSASFDNALMPKMRLHEAKLQFADLSNALLVDAKMAGTDLTGAVLRGTTLVGADLTRATLTGATFVGADLSNADLTCVSNPNCITLAQAPQRPPQGGDTRTQAPGQTGQGGQSRPAAAGPQDVCGRAAGGPKLDGAQLKGASLVDANLSNASLSGAEMVDVKELVKTDFSNADLRGAKLSKVVFKEAVNLKGACLCGADLSGADLSGASVGEGTTFRGANLFGATLPTNLQGVSFEGANIKGATFKGGSNLRDAILDHVVQADSDPFVKDMKCELRARTP